MLERYKEYGRIECGIDECGRGSLAGPVVAGAVIWPTEGVDGDECIRDSKKLTAEKRKTIAEFIKAHAVEWSVAYVDNLRIDDVNILRATHEAMHACVDQLQCPVDCLLVDGNTFTPYPGVQHTCVIKGDDTYMSIAAASIIAKVAHDEHVMRLSHEYPQYQWDCNMGYGTKAHIDSIYVYGLSPYHRRTFCRRLECDSQIA
jgi:ribonuclease HII